jgi:hypothetical protein
VLLCEVGVLVHGQPPPDPLIEGARNYARDYARSLPDYVVTRDTSRFKGIRPRLNGPPGDWQFADMVSAELTVRNGAESYANLRENGRPIAALPAGVWSTGEFAAELAAVLAPERNARFDAGHAESIRKRKVRRYKFSVDQKHSAWVLNAKNIPGSSDFPAFVCAYEGAIWVDLETAKILRVQMAAKDLPVGWPLDNINSQTDYDFIDIDGTPYVLPVNSESLSCETRAGVCFRNESAFHGYKKFQVNSEMVFDKGRQ